MKKGQTRSLSATAAAAAASGQLAAGLLLAPDGTRTANAQQDGKTMENAYIYCAVPASVVEMALHEHGRVDFGHALMRSRLGFMSLVVITQVRTEQHRLVIPLVGGAVARLLQRLRDTASPLLVMFGDLEADDVVRYGVDIMNVLDDAPDAHVDSVDVSFGELQAELFRLGLAQLDPQASPASPHNGKPTLVRAAVLIIPEHAKQVVGNRTQH